MKTLFIGYPKCTTCKKAYAALCDLGIEAEYRNIKEENPTKEEIQDWIDKGVSIDKLFNTSGMLYKSMDLKNKLPQMSEDEQLRLLATDGMLVKRPVIVDGEKVSFGFKGSL